VSAPPDPLSAGSSIEVVFLVVAVVLTLLVAGIFVVVLTRKEKR
jgi:hypothetical protein